MDADALTPDSPLPTDVAQLQALVRALLAKIAGLQAKLDAAVKQRFGRRSERLRCPSPQPKQTPPRSPPHGRAALPDHLERREVIHDLTPEQQRCPCCGQPRACIGEQTAEQLDLEPARFFVLRTIRRSYACHQCDPEAVPAEQRIQTAEPSQVGPIAKGLCGPGLLAYCLTGKYADHMPLHRLAGQLARSGVSIARSTLGDWMAAAADLLAPLCQLMHQRVLQSRVIHSDDTGVKVRIRNLGRTRKAHLWTAIGDADNPYVTFDFTLGYSSEGPARFLAGYRGYLQADALAQYEVLYEQGVQHVCCWAHARRKFVEAQDERGSRALEWIGQLYSIERDLPPLLAPSEDPVEQEERRQREQERWRIRQVLAKPILGELKAWLDEQGTKVLPKSPLGQAVRYARKNWAALERYTENGILSIDNNRSERTLRGVALGRHAWGVIGSAEAGGTAAVLYSVVGTCKHLAIDPFTYLREALSGLFALGENPTAEQLTAWLPDRWLLNRTLLAPAASG